MSAGIEMTAILDFFAPLVSLLGLSSAATIAAAVAVAIYLPGFRQLAITVGVGATLLFAGIAYGDRLGSDRIQVRWDAANAKAERDREQRDREIRERAEREAKKAIDELLRLAADSEKKALDYETELKNRATAACMLDDADLRRMPAIR
jgi:hypothetical protein